MSNERPTILEIRKNSLWIKDTRRIDNQQVNTLDIQMSGITKIDLRKSVDFCRKLVSYSVLEVINRSGRNIDIIGVNDACVRVKTKYAVKIHKGKLECQSSYPVV